MLNEQQINDVHLRLKEKNLRYHPLAEELLDHLCCGVEEQMELGYTFHQSVDLTFALFTKEEFQNIEKQTLFVISKKQRLMKAFSLFVLSLVLIIPTFNWLGEQDPPTISPIDGTYRISSGFGSRLHPLEKVKKMHKGIDFAAPIGTPVVATSDGVVIQAKSLATGYGNYIVIQHDEQYTTMYAQLNQIKVSEGQEVKKGELIGTVGSSGASTGPHLHYEVRVNGKQEDPEKFM